MITPKASIKTFGQKQPLRNHSPVSTQTSTAEASSISAKMLKYATPSPHKNKSTTKNVSPDSPTDFSPSSHKTSPTEKNEFNRRAISEHMKRIANGIEGKEFTYEMIIKLLKSIGTFRVLTEAAQATRINSKYFKQRLKREEEFIKVFWDFIGFGKRKVSYDILLDLLITLHQSKDKEENGIIQKLRKLFRELNRQNYTLQTRLKSAKDKAVTSHSPCIGSVSKALAEKNLRKYFPAMRKHSTHAEAIDDIDLEEHLVADERVYKEWKPPQRKGEENIQSDNEQVEFNVSPRVEAMFIKYKEAQAEIQRKRDQFQFKFPPECTFKPKLNATKRKSKEEQKKTMEERLLEECTFKPFINQRPSIKQIEGSPKGYKEAVLKMRSAKSRGTSPKRKAVTFEVKLSDKKTEQLVLTERSDLKLISVCFARKHNLGTDSAKLLVRLLQEKLKQLK